MSIQPRLTLHFTAAKKAKATIGSSPVKGAFSFNFGSQRTAKSVEANSSPIAPSKATTNAGGTTSGGTTTSGGRRAPSSTTTTASPLPQGESLAQSSAAGERSLRSRDKKDLAKATKEPQNLKRASSELSEPNELDYVDEQPSPTKRRLS
jgi:hypothetical protein